MNYAVQPKILQPDTLPDVLQSLRGSGKKMVFTNGCFDLLHPGHLHVLEFAAAQGDVLIVALNDDQSVRRLKGPSRPVFPLEVRMHMMAALGCVDYVISFVEDTPETLIHTLSPHVLVKGGDYQPDEIVGGDWVIQQGGEVRICPDLPGFRTSLLLGS